MRRLYNVDEQRLREAEGQAEQEMDYQNQYDARLDDPNALILATNIGTGNQARSAREAQREIMKLFPNAPILHARINQQTGEVER